MFKLYLTLCVVIGAFATSIPRIRDLREFKDFLGKSSKGDGKTLESRMATNPKAKAWENSGRFQGDIVLDAEEINGMTGSFGTRKAYIRPNSRWPGNTVVYEFAWGHFSASQRTAIIAGVNDITRNTCVRFRQRRFGEINYVLITNHNDGCYANVGFSNRRGAHVFNLADNCFLHTTVVHEWLHVLGFWHMQSTYTRDRYVQVLWGNIWPGMEHNFDMYTNDVVSNVGLPYEYASNMHYDAYAFSNNGRPTLHALFDDGGMMGQQQFITATDWRRVNRHYNCPGAWN